jgi:hypothetical protein
MYDKNRYRYEGILIVTTLTHIHNPMRADGLVPFYS